MTDNGQKSRWDYLGEKPEDTEKSEETSQPESPEHSLCEVADTNPDLALEFIEKTIEDNPEAASELYVMTCKVIAFKAKGIQPLRESQFTRVDVAEPEELRGYLQEGHLDWLELALNEISGIEKLDSEKEYMKVLAPDIDCVACIVEKCRPGRVQEMLGWTKLWYFGLSRIKPTDYVKQGIPIRKVNEFLKVPFSFPRIVKSAVAYDFGTDEREREYITFRLFPDFISDWANNDEIGDHEMGGVTIYDDGTYEIEEQQQDPGDLAVENTVRDLTRVVDVPGMAEGAFGDRTVISGFAKYKGLEYWEAITAHRPEVMDHVKKNLITLYQEILQQGFASHIAQLEFRKKYRGYSDALENNGAEMRAGGWGYPWEWI